MKIAVCIPAFNDEDTLCTAIDSLIAQRPHPFDIHIFDDASQDGTSSLIKKYGDRVICHRNATNLGYVGNLNACLGLCDHYDWIGILHSDDRHESDSIANFLKAISKHPGAGIVFSDIHLMDDKCRIFRRAKGRYHIYRRGGEAVGRCQGQLPCSTLFYRSEAIRDVGLYDPSFPYSADEEYNARIAGRYDIVECEDVLASYRRHDDHLMIKTWLKPDFIANFETMRLKMAGYAGFTGEKAIQFATRNLAADFISCAMELSMQGHQAKAVDYYAYAWKYHRALFLSPFQVAKIILALTPVIGPFLLRMIINVKRWARRV